MADRRVVDPREIDRAGDGRHLSPQEGESRLSDELEGVVEARVELVVPGDGELPVPGTDLPQLRRGLGHAVELAVHEIARGDEKIRRCLADPPENLGEPLPPHQDADMDVGDLDDPDLFHRLREFRRTDLDPFRPDLARLEEPVPGNDKRHGERDEEERPGGREIPGDVPAEDKAGGMNEKTEEIDQQSPQRRRAGRPPSRHSRSTP